MRLVPHPADKDVLSVAKTISSFVYLVSGVAPSKNQ